MIRPEPDQTFDEADVGGERGVVARLGLFKINLLRDAGAVPLSRGLTAGWRHCVAGLTGLRLHIIFGTLGFALSLAFLAEFEGLARRAAATEKIGIFETTGAEF